MSAAMPRRSRIARKLTPLPPSREWATDLLHSDSLLDQGLLKKSMVRREWQRFLTTQAPTSWEMWSLVMYLAWLSGRSAAEPAVQLRRSA